MSVGLIKDLLCSEGYSYLGPMWTLGDVQFEIDAVQGEGSMSSLILLWDGHTGYEALGREVMALRALLAHGVFKRPIALVTIDDPTVPVPPRLSRLIRTVLVPCEAGPSEMRRTLSCFLPLRVPEGAVEFGDPAARVREDALGFEAGAVDALLGAAQESSDAVTAVLCRLVEDAISFASQNEEAHDA